MSLPIAENVVNEFLEELSEMTERISRSLTVLEKSPSDQALVRSLYRDVHTIKGNAMMFGLPLLGRLSHSMENVLELVREKKQALSPELLQQIFSAIDLIGAIATSIRDAGVEPGIDIAVDALVEDFQKALSGLSRQESNYTEAPPELKQAAPGGSPSVTLDAPLKLEPETSVQAPVDIPEPQSKVSSEPLDTAPKPPVRQQSDETVQDSIRVNVLILDKLVNLVGELVLVRNQYQERAKSLEDEDMQISQRLNLVTVELQNEVMKTRMQPVGNILNKFHRVVRDLSRELGKESEVVIKGTDTELDKALLEAIRDPLMHIVRNSTDHGIETPDVRLAAGKPRSGLISVSASQQGGQVVIEIADDGKGLHVEGIRAKAIEKGLITADSAPHLSERDTFNLIFRPGFSTAEKVSNVSGRGVGMDVVKTNIERIGGTVEMRSTLGRGSTTLLRIPLTLAIMPALLVKVANASLAIPQARLIELLRVEFGADATRKIEVLEGRPFFRLRGQLLPLVTLDSVLSQSEVNDDATTQLLSREEGLNIVVVDGEGVTFGLIVDDIEDSIDIVIKPLGQVLKAVSIFSGSTILGDGSIALLLDVTGIAAYAGIKKIFDQDEVQGSRYEADSSEAQLIQDEVNYLIVKLDSEGNYAIPVCNVSRLEEFARSKYHKAGDFLVCRYREALLPILSVREILRLEPAPDKQSSDVSSVIVVSRGGKFYGLEVEDIEDIIATTSDIDGTVRDRAGLLGGFIHNDSVFVVIDVFEVIDQIARPGAEKIASLDAADDGSDDLSRLRKNYRILLAEDSNFFRKQMARSLSDCGYAVTTAVDGSKAWDLISGPDKQEFHLLLSDIEMPEMDGVTLARKVRELSDWHAKPLIAVTTKYSEADVKVGLEAGFSQYLQKLDRDDLISEIDKALGLVS